MRFRLKLSRARLLLIGVIALILLVILVGGAGYVLGARLPGGPPSQPIAFNHKAMVGVGITCLYCHSTAQRSPVAGMPSVEKCMGCHQVISTDKPEIQKLAAYWNQQQPIPWARVNQLPRYVFFSHQVHVHAGLNCERCHGNVAQMTVAVPVETMNMGWCLNCHEQQPNGEQLKDCVVCHR
jgi:c(7)-type cytochrome triheme protein